MGYLRGRRNFRGQPAFGFRTNIQRFAARRRTVSLESHALSTPAARAKTRRCQMFKWALIFAVIALIAAVLGFGGVAGAAAGVAKILFFVGQVGRASCRERVCKDVESSGVAVAFKKKKKQKDR